MFNAETVDFLIGLLDGFDAPTEREQLDIVRSVTLNLEAIATQIGDTSAAEQFKRQRQQFCCLCPDDTEHDWLLGYADFKNGNSRPIRHMATCKKCGLCVNSSSIPSWQYEQGEWHEVWKEG